MKRLQPALLAIMLLGLVLRLWGIRSQSMSMDEVGELRLSQETIPNILTATDGFPPLYHLVLRGWIALFGIDSARWLSVVCGMLLLGVVWQLGKLIGGRRTAIAGSLLVAVSPVNVWYAQESRANMLFYLLAVTAIWLWHRALANGRGLDWTWYALCALAGLYSHDFFTLVIAGLLASLLLEPDRWARLKTAAVVHGLVALGAIPWLFLLSPDLHLQANYGIAAVGLDLKTLAYTLVTLLFGFSVGPSLRDLHGSHTGSVLMEALPWGVAAAAITLAFAWVLWTTPAVRPWVWRLGIVAGVPILACGVADAILDLGYRVRYVAWVSVPILMLFGLALAHGRRRTIAAGAAGLMVVLSAVSLINRNLVGRYMNEDTRSAATYLSATPKESGPIFVASSYMATPLRHYLGAGRTAVGLPAAGRDGDPRTPLDEIAREVAAGEPFWLVYSRPWDDDPRGRLKEELVRNGALELEAEWPGVELYRARGW